MVELASCLSAQEVQPFSKLLNRWASAPVWRNETTHIKKNRCGLKRSGVNQVALEKRHMKNRVLEQGQQQADVQGVGTLTFGQRIGQHGGASKIDEA